MVVNAVRTDPRLSREDSRAHRTACQVSEQLQALFVSDRTNLIELPKYVEISYVLAIAHDAVVPFTISGRRFSPSDGIALP